MFEDRKKQRLLMSVHDTELHTFNHRLFVCMWTITENVKKNTLKSISQ
jgi:hypothetical protein